MKLIQITVNIKSLQRQILLMTRSRYLTLLVTRFTANLKYK